MAQIRKYRVNASEVFNLHAMYDHLKCQEIDAIDNGDNGKLDMIWERLDEIENLLEHASYVGSLVTWPELKRIREIRDERNAIRYGLAVQNGNFKNAKYAIM